jgi:hypothetical protein
MIKFVVASNAAPHRKNQSNKTSKPQRALPLAKYFTNGSALFCILGLIFRPPP